MAEDTPERTVDNSSNETPLLLDVESQTSTPSPVTLTEAGKKLIGQVIDKLPRKQFAQLSAAIYSATNPSTYIIPLAEVTPTILETVINCFGGDLSKDDETLQNVSGVIALLCYFALVHENWKSYRKMIEMIYAAKPETSSAVEQSDAKSTPEGIDSKPCYKLRHALKTISQHVSPIAKGAASSLSFASALNQIIDATCTLTGIPNPSPYAKTVIGKTAGYGSLIFNVFSQYINFGISKKPGVAPTTTSPLTTALESQRGSLQFFPPQQSPGELPRVGSLSTIDPEKAETSYISKLPCGIL